MKKILGICLVAASLSGCMTTRACVKREHTLVVQGNATHQAELTELNVAWMEQYCRMVIAEEQRYAKLTKAKTLLLPDFCVGSGLDK